MRLFKLTIIFNTLFYLCLAPAKPSLASEINLLKDFRKKELRISKIPKPLKEISIQINQANSKDKSIDLDKKLSELLSSLGRGYHDEIWFLKGITEEKFGNFKKAKKSYLNSLKRKSNQTSSLARLGVVETKLENYENAIEILNEARWRTDVKNPELSNLLAKVFIKINKPEKAEKLLDKSSPEEINKNENLELKLQTKLQKLQKSSIPLEKAKLKQDVILLLDSLISDGNRKEKIINLYAEYTINISDPLIDAVKFNFLENLLYEEVKKDGFKNEKLVSHLTNCLIIKQKIPEAKELLKKARAVLPNSAKLLDLQKQLKIESGE